MSEKQVTRYYPTTDKNGAPYLREHFDGPWVRWDDYAALAAERDRLEEECKDTLRGYARATETAEALAARVERLEGALLKIRALEGYVSKSEDRRTYARGWDCGYESALEESRDIAAAALEEPT